MPKISVIIPTYNSAGYLPKAIDSVLSQTYSDYEIIVVDDGSGDDTRSMMEEYIEKYPVKIKYFYQGNKGPGAARNRGIKEAKGEWVAFLDADDKWHNEKLALQTAYIDKNPGVSMVSSEFEIVDEHNKLTGYSARKKKIESESDIVKGVFKHYLLMSTVMVKRDVFGEVGYFDETLTNAEDTEMQLRIVKRFNIGLMDERLANHRKHIASLTKLASRKEVLKRWNDRRKVIKGVFKSEGGPATFDDQFKMEVLSKTYFEYAIAMLTLNEFKRAKIQIVRSLKYDVSLKSVLMFLKIVLMDVLGKDMCEMAKGFKRAVSKV